MGVIPTAWAKFTKTSEIEDPLLKVPPARRGNRRAWFPSRSGGNLKEGGKYELCPRDWYKGYETNPRIASTEEKPCAAR
jgi:hypothetical protein